MDSEVLHVIIVRIRGIIGIGRECLQNVPITTIVHPKTEDPTIPTMTTTTTTASQEMKITVPLMGTKVVMTSTILHENYKTTKTGIDPLTDNPNLVPGCMSQGHVLHLIRDIDSLLREDYKTIKILTVRP